MRRAAPALLVLAACAAPRVEGPGGPPAAYVVTVTAYELPVALAELLDVPADDREPVIASGLDLDARLAGRARALEKEHGLVPVEFPAKRALPDAWTTLAAPPDASAALRGLELAVFPMPRASEWAPTALDVSVTWRGADGRVLARLPSSAHPLPPSSCARVVCLPPRSRVEAERAIAAFVRVVPARE